MLEIPHELQAVSWVTAQTNDLESRKPPTQSTEPIYTGMKQA